MFLVIGYMGAFDGTTMQSLTHYASLSSGDAYSDRQLTPNFELCVEIFLCADMFLYEDLKTVTVFVSVCTPEKKSPSFVNIQYQSYISN